MDLYCFRNRYVDIFEQTALNPFLKKLSEGLAQFPPETKFLVGISGGRDSMCLLYGLLALEYRQLTLCHLNHQLRGVAARMDECFVIYQAQKLGLSLKLARAQTEQFASDHGLCTEMAARELRYTFFAEVAKEAHCSTLLLAHHADDQLETCWINLLRGTGTAGLAGMRMESARRVKKGREGILRIIRPLLRLFRSEVVQFSCERKIPFREDATNQDTNLMRNRIRHELLPFLDRRFGINYRRAMLRCAEILADEEDWMREITERFSCKTPRLAYNELYPLPRALQRRILRRWLLKQGVPEVGFAAVERVRSLTILPISQPAKVNLPFRIHARRRSGMLFLEKSPRSRQVCRKAVRYLLVNQLQHVPA
ncbi:MAG: tRNA lysidine(34) synthetase TilS [Candidatus Xiphinematobacter sp.]|nr:MAG: tRNA lysidine(34) synthetase TilS [Candidatus Xiphinematobacter sp.]QQY09268.1 MAG: tRNA lysidine(34) synthetase TilS [Candidatus Xiphinematobacter sp.]QQY10752.1 MAG: tRNA lysidine(34) synthetase TilS [Candidatus Xiphinematobacter sp.]QQY11498.1 MAG: tRNA lysidine(34) synthetase TilS [Candidatus Xiphinematobacter sp.]